MKKFLFLAFLKGNMAVSRNTIVELVENVHLRIFGYEIGEEMRKFLGIDFVCRLL